MIECSFRQLCPISRKESVEGGNFRKRARARGGMLRKAGFVIYTVALSFLAWIKGSSTQNALRLNDTLGDGDRQAVTNDKDVADSIGRVLHPCTLPDTVVGCIRACIACYACHIAMSLSTELR